MNAANSDVLRLGFTASIMEDMSGRELSEAERFQQLIEPYSTRLLRALQASGAFAGAQFDHDGHALIVYGVGEPSPEVAALLAEAPEILEVVWVSAPYTHAELVAETERIFMLASKRLSTGGPRTDGTALEFTTTDAELLATDDPQEMLGSRYPVTIRYGERPTRK
jgi:hypothetical protein